MRLQQFDLLKGFGMILVLVGHVNCSRLIFNDIYLFHMPLFFFASGCFFKMKQQSLKDFMGKNAKRLLIPYLFFLALFFFFNLLEAVFWPDANGVHAAIKSKLVQFGIGFLGMQESLSFRSIWFLICLFEVSLIYWILAHIKKLGLRTFVSVILFGAGYLLQIFKIDISFFMDTAISVQFFYHLGYLFFTKELYRKRFSPWISLACIVIIYFFFNQLTVYTDYRTNRFVLVSVPLAILLVWNFYNLFNNLANCRLANSKSVQLLNKIGVDSLLLFGVHRNFYIMLKPLLNTLPINEYVVSAILVVCASAGTLALSRPLAKYIPRLIGKG